MGGYVIFFKKCHSEQLQYTYKIIVSFQNHRQVKLRCVLFWEISTVFSVLCKPLIRSSEKKKTREQCVLHSSQQKTRQYSSRQEVLFTLKPQCPTLLQGCETWLPHRGKPHSQTICSNGRPCQGSFTASELREMLFSGQKAPVGQASSCGTHLMVLSEEPLTTRRSRYCRQAMPRLCPFSVRTNSHVLVLHTWGHGTNSLRLQQTVLLPHQKPRGTHRQRGLRLTEEGKPTEHLQRPRAGPRHQWGPAGTEAQALLWHWEELGIVSKILSGGRDCSKWFQNLDYTS